MHSTKYLFFIKIIKEIFAFEYFFFEYVVFIKAKILFSVLVQIFKNNHLRNLGFILLLVIECNRYKKFKKVKYSNYISRSMLKTYYAI